MSYELLFRSIGSREAALFTDESQASASVIIDMLSEFGLEQVIGRNKGFINVELDLLMSEAIEILPRERVVLELLESIPLTDDLVKRCRELKEKGYTLALDDHQFDPAYEELYGIVEIIKVDLIQSPADQLAGMIELFRPYPVKLLAEKVETRDEYLQCHKLGFDYFQGYYFARPAVIEKKRIDEAASTLLKLIRLLSEDADIGGDRAYLLQKPRPYFQAAPAGQFGHDRDAREDPDHTSCRGDPWPPADETMGTIGAFCRG